MKFKVLNFLVSSIFVSSSWAHEHSSLQKIRKLSLVNGCKIYNYTGNWVKTIPGSICLFNKDGSVISADDKYIRKYSKFREILWEIPGHFHHQINFSNDGKDILALSSEMIKENGLDVRYDTFLKISLEGKILYQQSSKELLAQFNQKALPNQMTGPLKTLLKTETEATHFNSIYQIPKITSKNVPAFIHKDNVVVNGIDHGTYILSPDLKTVLYHQTFDSLNHNIHDVQVRSNGNFLIFNNRADDEYSVMLKYSAIQEINPKSLKVEFEFTGNPKTMFYSPFCGGIQEIDNDLLGISHVMNGFYVYSRSMKTIVASVPGFTGNDQIYYPSQQIKAYNLEDFLKNWDN